MGASLDFSQLLGDLSILGFARFLLPFSFLLPLQETLQVFKPQDSRILIFLVEFVAVFVCCDEILLRYVVVFSDEIQSFSSNSYFQCALRANTKINKVQNLNEIQEFKSNYFTEGEISCTDLRRFEKIFAQTVKFHSI